MIHHRNYMQSYQSSGTVESMLMFEAWIYFEASGTFGLSMPLTDSESTSNAQLQLRASWAPKSATGRDDQRDCSRSTMQCPCKRTHLTAEPMDSQAAHMLINAYQPIQRQLISYQLMIGLIILMYPYLLIMINPCFLTPRVAHQSGCQSGCYPGVDAPCGNGLMQKLMPCCPLVNNASVYVEVARHSYMHMYVCLYFIYSLIYLYVYSFCMHYEISYHISMSIYPWKYVCIQRCTEHKHHIKNHHCPLTLREHDNCIKPLIMLAAFHRDSHQ